MSRKLSFIHPALQEVAHREWLITNGIGGYAASSICGMNTRRYHGLLVASFNPPTERKVLVSRVEETVHLNHGSFELATNQYPGSIHPQGYQQVTDFSREPFPQTVFRFEGVELRKTLFMPHKSNTTIIEYHNPTQIAMELDLRPHFVDRDYHSLFSQSEEFDYHLEKGEGYCSLYSKYGAQALYLGFAEGEFVEDRSWYKQVEYLKEQERGQDFVEDTFQPGYIRLRLEPGSKFYLVLTLEKEMLFEDPVSCMDLERKRLEALVPEEVHHPFSQALIKSADQFIVHRDSTHSETIIAGYPWFTDWGRDTMIAMRGLTIAMGKQEESRSILETFLEYLDRGMLPNRFPDNGEIPEYNTIDATLWLFVVLHDYVQAFGDWDFIESIYPKLYQVIESHMEGTRYDIHVTSEGFLFGGNPNTQLTWMDARMWGHAFTPRWGCPVEINALWYNALRILEYFAEQLGRETAYLNELANRLEKNFRSQFVHPDGYLYDVLVPNDWKDDSFRPNQLYALSLPFALMNQEEGRRILELVEEKLLTPFGLRTLASDHPEFKPVYTGKQWDRDGAYHQGTVWPFLLGEYFQAKIHVEGISDALKEELEARMQALKAHFFYDNCINGMSEIFDGGDPNTGKGTFHQAWSVSALLALIMRYGLFEKKSHEVANPEAIYDSINQTS